MDLYARVNILGGRAVRLNKGDVAQAMALDADPLARAKGWVEKGVDYLLAVDLDAAAHGSYRNRSLIDRMLEEVEVPMVVAGGVRSDLEAARLIEQGAWRVMMGTAAIEDQNMVWDLCRTYPGRMMVSIDVLETEELVTRGWTANSGRFLEEVLLEMSSAGVSGFFISEARRDILTEAPNLAILQSALEYVDEPVIAAGGVRHLDDLQAMMTLEASGRTLAGLVVGREVTEGRFTVEQAQATLTGTVQQPLSRVRQVRAVIHCEEMTRSADFYEGVLGFRRLDAWMPTITRVSYSRPATDASSNSWRLTMRRVFVLPTGSAWYSSSTTWTPGTIASRVSGRRSRWVSMTVHGATGHSR